jgi:hypothetical protein
LGSLKVGKFAEQTLYFHGKLVKPINYVRQTEKDFNVVGLKGPESEMP